MSDKAEFPLRDVACDIRKGFQKNVEAFIGDMPSDVQEFVRTLNDRRDPFWGNDGIRQEGDFIFRGEAFQFFGIHTAVCCQKVCVFVQAVAQEIPDPAFMGPVRVVAFGNNNPCREPHPGQNGYDVSFDVERNQVFWPLFLKYFA